MIILICNNVAYSQSSPCEVFSQTDKLCDQFPNLTVNETLSGNYNNIVNRNGQVLLLNGTVTFRNGCNLINCKIIASLGSKLIMLNDAQTCQGCPPVPLKTYRFLNTKMFPSCSTANWQGLVANANTIVELNNNCEVELAKVGIHANAGSNLRIWNSKFWDNEIAINAIGNVAVLAMKGNLFTSRSNEVQERTGTLTGIRIVNNKNVFNIGGAPTNIGLNIFKYLTKAIDIIKSSSVEISNTQFINNVYGVSAGTVGEQETTGKLTINGLTNSSMTFCNNTASDVATFSNYNISINNCKITRNDLASIAGWKDAYISINVTRSKNTTINIDNCKWNINSLEGSALPAEFGPSPNLLIYYTDCTNIGGTVSNCEINENNSLGHLYPIYFKKVVGVPTYYKFFNNKINAITSTEFTCYFSNCEKIMIEKFENIERTGTSFPAIETFFGNDIKILNNTIIGDKRNENNLIRIHGTDNAVVCDNKLSDCVRGIQVEAGCDAIKVGNNTFGYNLEYPLYYVKGTLTHIPNSHTMNHWLQDPNGPVVDYIFMANHEGNTYVSNIYVVRKDNYGFTNPFYTPDQLFVFPSDEQWFVPFDDGSPLYCGDNSLNDRIRGFTPLGDNNYRQQLSDGQLWDSDKAFFKYFSDNPSVQLPTDLQTLYNTISQTNIPSFLTTAVLMNNIHSFSSQLLSDYNLVSQQIATLTQSINDLDAILADLPDITGTEPEFIQRQALAEQLNTRQDELAQIMSSLLAEYQSDISVATLSNNSLNPITTKEIEEKQLNSLYLSKLSGITFSTSDITTLQNLAARCILDHGNTVLYAQSLLPLEYSYYREPKMFCSLPVQSLVSQRIEKVSPSSNDNTIYNLIEIYSIDGKLNTSFKNISMLELRQKHQELKGLYIMKCTDHNGSIQTFRQLLW